MVAAPVALANPLVAKGSEIRRLSGMENGVEASKGPNEPEAAGVMVMVSTTSLQAKQRSRFHHKMVFSVSRKQTEPMMVQFRTLRWDAEDLFEPWVFGLRRVTHSHIGPLH